jgi:VanZ family protein
MRHKDKWGHKDKPFIRNGWIMPAEEPMKKMMRWLPSVVWMGVIFCLSSQTGDNLGSWLPVFQQFVPWMQGFDWGHFVAYFLLALTFAWALAVRKFTWKEKLAVIALSVLYGVTDEFHQSFVPGRSPDIHDLRNDGIGAALAVLFLSIPFVKRRFCRLAGVKYY